MSFDEYVSIGCCCESTFATAPLRPDMTSYPFDAALVVDLAAICDSIDNKFSLWNPENWRLIENPYYNNQKMYYLSGTKIYFPHSDGNFKAIRAKVDNFIELLASNKRVLFVWKSHVYANPAPAQIERFIKIINDRSNTMKFRVLLVNEYTPLEKIIDGYPEQCTVVNVIDNISKSYTVDTHYMPCSIRQCKVASKELIEAVQREKWQVNSS